MYDIKDRAEAVKQIQRFLISAAYKEGILPVLTVDGIYGEETREAVRRFQAKNKLPETGVTDYATWRRLYEEYKENETKSGSDLLPSVAFPLQMGDSGSHISLLQTVLEELTEQPISKDNFFGRKTEEAVRHLEGRYGRRITGEVSEALWRLMAIEYKEKSERR